MFQTTKNNSSNIQPKSASYVENTNIEKLHLSTNDEYQTQLSNKSNEGDIKQTTNEYKCTICSKKFSNLPQCLTHELNAHVLTTEQSAGKCQSSGRKRKTKSKNFVLSEETDVDIEFRNTVKSTLSDCPNNKVLQEFCRLFQPSPENLNTVYQKIYHDLQTELSKIGNWEVHPFGSTINAMALKSSDMDFYINCISGNTRFKNPKKLFYQVKDILFCGQLFSNVMAIPRARVPVIKCKNNFTGIHLDLNLTSCIGVFNSQFIGKIIAYDNRIHPVLLVIKVWAKMWEITKTGRVTNYCLTWLVFFYLENCQPPVIPPIKKFQENCEPLIIEGFNFGFEHPDDFNKDGNKQHIIELLRGFFKFYTNYDYENYIICPYLGVSIDKKNFSENKFSYPEYEEQFKRSKQQFKQSTDYQNDERMTTLKINTPIVIQDPFCLILNKFNTGRHIFAHFYNRIVIANKIMSDNNTTFGTLLIKLLYETVPIQKENSAIMKPKPKPINIGECNSNVEVNSSNIINCTLNPLETELTFVRNYLRKKYPEQTFDTNDIKKHWCEKILIYFVDILEKVYKIDVNYIHNENIYKSLKNSDQSDIHSNDNMTKIYNLKSILNLWSNRKTINTKPGYAIYLEKTLRATELLEKQRNCNPSFQAHLNCKIIFQMAKDYSSLHIEMINLNGKIGKSAFRTLFTEYSTNSRNTIIAYFEKLSRE